ncbi:MAG: PDZ domain-containing protein, partial [Gemmataceae bacterium]
VSGGNAEEIAKLKKDLTEAAKKGDVEAVKKLADQLEKAAGAKVITMTGQAAGAGLPAVPAVPGTPGIAIGGKGSTATIRTKIVRGDNAEIAGFEKAIEGLKKSAEELKDNPEAKAAIDKTIAEYRKKIEEAKVRGEVPQVMVIEGAPAVGKKPIAQVAPLPPLPAIAPIPPGGLNFGLGVNREAITDQLKANLDSTLKSYRAKIEGVKDNAEARKALEKAMESYEAAMKAAIAGMALDTVRIWDAPGEGAEGKFFRMVQGGAAGEKMTVRKVGQGRFGITPALIPDVLIEQLDLPRGQGVLVTAVNAGSAADKAGIRVNDVVTTIGEKPCPADPLDVVRLINETPGGTIDVALIRKGKKETVKVNLPEIKKETPKKAAAAGTFSSKSISINDDKFKVDATNDVGTFGITGAINDGKAAPEVITITANGKTSAYTTLEKVPAEHRDTVNGLLKGIGGNR